MTRLALALSALSLLLGATSTAQANSTVAQACPGHVQAVYFYRNATRRWERKLGRAQMKSVFNAHVIRSCNYVLWVAHTWQRRAVKVRVAYIAYAKRLAEQAIPSSLDSAFRCIHRFEGAWTSNTGNGYYGGMQMDLAFQSLYGPEYLSRWGTADHWPVWAQMKAAARAYSSGRGFTPWPNTARICGLL